MHIADGILGPEAVTVTSAAALAASSFALKRLGAVQVSRARTVATAGLAAVAILAVSSAPLPAWPGTSAHALATPFVALIGGVPLAFLATGVVVFMQALGGHGGLSAWGADVITMGLIGPLVTVVTYRVLADRYSVAISRAAALAALGGCTSTYLATAALIAFGLSASGAEFPMMFAVVAGGYLPAELPTIAVESIATGLLAARMMRSDLASRLTIASPLFGGQGTW